MGIPATSVGTIVGGGAHTREEWINATSLPKGLAITLALMLRHVSTDALAAEEKKEA